MNRKNFFSILILVLGGFGVYWASIGGFSFNPQTVTMSSGSTRPVGNGRAQILIDEVGLSAGVTIWCDKERASLELPLDGTPSEKICGIQASVLEVLEGKMGLPKVKLRINW